MKVYYNPDYIGAEHHFDTTRKAGWIAESLRERPILNVELHTPLSVTAEELASVHHPAYIEAVRTGVPRELATSQGFTAWGPRLWTTVTASTGGVVAAAFAALADGVAGSLSSGLHHARFATGVGFCTFNGLVLAAEAIHRNAGRLIRRILIIDLDAHGGGGTYSLIAILRPYVYQIDIAVSRVDGYAPQGTPKRTYDYETDANQYLGLVEQRLEEFGKLGRFDLCLYNAGMDPYEGCVIGGLTGITADILRRREAMVFDWCHAHNIPVAFVLAGGYISPKLSKRELVDLHRLTISAAAKLTQS